MPDVFPSDFLQDVADIKHDAKQAKGAIGNRAPLTEASKGWILRGMSAPDTSGLGPDDVWIHARDGRFWVSSQSGSIPLNEFAQGDAVSNPAYTLTNATPTYTQGQVQTIVNTLDALFASHLALLASLRAADIIDT